MDRPLALAFNSINTRPVSSSRRRVVEPGNRVGNGRSRHSREHPAANRVCDQIARYRRSTDSRFLGRERYALIIEGSPKCRDIGENCLHFRSSITIQIQEEGIRRLKADGTGPRLFRQNEAVPSAARVRERRDHASHKAVQSEASYSCATSWTKRVPVSVGLHASRQTGRSLA